ncbi:MAG: ATPase, T2SS/T4P/T4SS family [Armatimonadota bacterium]
MVTETFDQEELMSLEAAADFLCVSKSTMYRLLDQGKLRGMKAGKQWRFRKEDLLAYMQRDPAAQALANIPVQVLDTELDFFAGELERAGTSTEASDDSTLEGEAGKITQLVRRMVWLLYTRKGSDLHLEPTWDAGEEYSLLRLRVDGLLHETRRLPARLHAALVMHWKDLAGMDRDSTFPQDGSARFIFGTHQGPFRVSIVPTLYGEKVAVRTVPQRIPSLAELGLDNTRLPEWSRRQRGLMLITGPTGSGKTTTTVACMKERVSPGINVMSVEEPVEYLFPGVMQVQVKGFPRVDALRALFRQDPDIIYVGELLGDAEYSDLAVHAAETGHLVLATMHAHDAITPLYTLVEQGVKRSLLSSNLIGTVTQRLLMRLCPKCCVPSDTPISEDVRAAAAAGGFVIPKGAHFFTRGKGCEACNQRGGGGRFALHEFFEFTPETRASFNAGAGPEELRKLAIQQGMRTAFAEGIRRALDGEVTLEEVLQKVPS